MPRFNLWSARSIILLFSLIACVERTERFQNYWRPVARLQIRPWRTRCGVSGVTIHIDGSMSSGIGNMQKQFLDRDGARNMIC